MAELKKAEREAKGLECMASNKAKLKAEDAAKPARERVAAAVALNTEHSKWQGAVAEAERAINNAAPDTVADADAVEKAKAELETAQADQKIVRAVFDAGLEHKGVIFCTTMAKRMSPDGLRLDKLRGRLNKMHSMLDWITNNARWQKVRVSSKNLAITYGGLPIEFCSTSEQFRARVALQLTIAIVSKDDMVVIDAADVLDDLGLRGLAKILLPLADTKDLCIVVTCTGKQRIPQMQGHTILEL